MSQRAEKGVIDPDFINKVKMTCMQCGAELNYEVFLCETNVPGGDCWDGLKIECVRCQYIYYFGA
ncbi:hypothetical protein LCGC14_1748930 [marine sediment metagenome]|uniref:Uncharacterized protein n=1 Tax=marine sediment metagenome TaxID=412755 RepID=A0A0F9JJK3_9ZZZZ